MEQGRSEIKILNIYANCWNNLDAQELIPFLDENVTYKSQWVDDSILGKTKFLEYFEGKLKTIKKLKDETSVKAVVGHQNYYLENTNKPCLFLTQTNQFKKNEVVIIEIEIMNNKVVCIEMIQTPNQQ